MVSSARSIARRLDELGGSHNLEHVYTAQLFISPIPRQPGSRLLELPSEVRQQIYRHVFECDLGLHLGRRAYIQLALLQTCRLIHSEAHKLAFNTWYFHVLDGPRLIKGKPSRRWRRNGCKSVRSKTSNETKLTIHKALSQRLWTLSARINHLRYVGITMPHAKLNPLSKDNPFLLMQLHLNELSIGFTGTLNGPWTKDVIVYHNLMCSLLCLSQKIISGNQPAPIHAHTKEKLKRLVALKRWLYKPQSTDLHRMLQALETKKVIVRATHDLLWKTFVFFGLFTTNEWGLSMKHVDGDRYLHFLEEEVLPGSAALEFGLVEHRSDGF